MTAHPLTEPSRSAFQRLCGILLLLCLTSCHRGVDGGPTLDSVRKIQEQGPSKLQMGLPVSLKGTVTYHDARSRLLMVQDATGGILVEQGDATPELRQGDLVSIEGFTAYESFSPVIVKPRLTRLLTGTLPSPLRADPDQLFKGRLDCRRVQLECDVIAGRATANNSYELDATLNHHPFRITGNIATRFSFIQLLAHAKIRIKGVPLTTYYPSGEIYSLTLYCSGLEGDLEVLQGQVGNSGPPPPPSGPPESLPTLRAIGSLKMLSNLEARKGYPVRFKGVVTNWDADLDWLILEDNTGGVFVYPPQQSVPGLGFGVLVEVEGRSLGGSFAPVVRPDKLRVLGVGTLPKPSRVRPSEGFTALDENRWTLVEGVIREVRPDPFKGTRLVLAEGQELYQVVLHAPAPEAQLAALLDCRARIQGVYAPIFSGDQRLMGFQITAPDIRSVEVLDRPQGDTFESPAHPIHSLLEYNPKGIPKHRVKVEGRITRASGNSSVYLADATGGIRLDVPSSSNLHTGDSIQAVGFLNWSRATAMLQNVVVRTCAPLPEVSPLPIAADAALSGVCDNRLIQVEGFLREHTQSFGDRIFSLESGRTKFTAVLEHPQAFVLAEQLRNGALLKLTGVCDIRWNEKTTPPTAEGMQILLRSPADITILRNAPWWTLGRALTLAAGLIAVLLAAMGWLVMLRRQVRARTEQLRKQMHHRETLEDQLRQAQKLEGVGRLAGGVAHDFNNLLTVINGYCELLLMEMPDGTDLKTSTLEIKKAADRAASLTKQLLAFSRKQILQPVLLDLNDLVMDMDAMLRRLIREDIELTTRRCAEPCLIQVDRGQISQVLMNLVVNARDAMPGGGRMIIETSHVFLEPKQLEMRPDVVPGPYVKMTVTDTGMGMDEETLKQIFEPFFTTKGPGKGTGLGLSTVFGIVKQSGGHIWAYSEPGQGTTFKLFFPRLQTPPEEEISESGELAPGGGETILVVEDQSDLRQLVRKTLEGRGYKILSVDRADEAVELARDHPGAIHLLLTDVVMPGLNGKELAAKVLELRPGIGVLYMSGYTEDVIVHKGVLEPGIAFIQKPFSTRELATRVKEVLKQG